MISKETVLSSLNLITHDGNLKNAAVLLFAHNPERFFECTGFKIERYASEGTNLIIQDIIEGNLIQMADRVINVLKERYLLSPIHYEGLQRIEKLEIPEDALREAILNSISHRTYSGIPIRMKVYNDYIWMWNEGNLPRGFTTDTLESKHISRPRNVNIANVFYRARFVESMGIGIQKIIKDFRAAGLDAPKFTAEQGGLSVRIPRPENIIADGRTAD